MSGSKTAEQLCRESWDGCQGCPACTEGGVHPWVLGEDTSGLTSVGDGDGGGCGSARAAEFSQDVLPIQQPGSSEQPVPKEWLLPWKTISKLKKNRKGTCLLI